MCEGTRRRAWVLAAVLWSADAAAQVPRPQIERFDRPPDARELRGLEALPRPGTPGLVLPPLVPADRAAPLLSSGLRVFVRRFRISGNTAFTGAELHAIVAPYENREIGNEELEDIRLGLTRQYLDAGYINSGAVIPDQAVAAGTIDVKVIEGRLSDIAIAGENRFHPDFIRARIAPRGDAPLNVNRLQERMQLLLQNPQIERINAELAPGIRPGEGTLTANVKEAARYSYGAGLANNSAPSVGGVRAELRGAARNISGWGDALSVRAGHTRGVNDFSAGYELPVSAADTLLSLRYDRNTALIVEAPFDAIDIKNKSEKVELALSHPFMRTLQREFRLGLTLSRRGSATYLLGEPYSFSPGVNNGRSAVAALRLAAEWLERLSGRVIAARLSFSRGLDAFGSTSNDDGSPSSRFASWLGQFQWAERLSPGAGQLIFRADAQHAAGALLPMEKFAVGGAESVRGYREVRFVGDRGWTASIEYRHPLAQLSFPGPAGERTEAGTLSLAAFVDAGRAWDASAAGAPEKTLYAIGPGVRWDAGGGWQAQLYKGIALTRLQNRAHDLQDSGIHFRLSFQRAF